MDFAGQPISLSERRAEKSGKAKDWSPRDALVSLLREIDAGELDCDALVIAYREKIEGGETKVHFSASAPDGSISLGLLSRATYLINSA